jgi:type IX secretion system PorP/SprF family membrane protein
MKSIRLHIILFILLLSFSARAQQDVQLSQQFLSRININPASTKISNFADAYLFVRQQWIGFEDAPSTQMFNAHGYIDDIRSSVGLTFLNDMVGRNRHLNLLFSYAYHVKTGEESALSLGLSAGLVNRRLDGDMMTGMPEIDPEIIEMLTNGRGVYRPDVNFGLMFATPKFAFGLSVTHLTHYLYKETWFRFPMHGYAFIEYGIDFSENLRFTPRAQLMSALGSGNKKTTGETIGFMDRMDLLLDLGGTFMINNRFWLGGSFRSGGFDFKAKELAEKIGANSFTAIVGLNLGPNLRFGYSYDYKLGKTFQNVRTYGTHEIMLNYRMKIREEEAAEATPRFFE